MSMIEQVARAIKRKRHEKCCSGAALDDVCVTVSPDEIEQARAAIEAMREPAEAMWLAPVLADSFVSGILPSGAEAETIWQVMIGAALKE